ncbi:MAG TPA: hypothetical protein DEA08_22460 [Planctomycetes bacterium]|nr:hypothetical protein [Planctomycetota bacterium]
MSMLWFAYAVSLDELGQEAANRLAASDDPDEVRELFEELVRELGEPLEDEGVEGGILEEALSAHAPGLEAMRPGLPEPFLGRAQRGFRSEIGFLDAAQIPVLCARLRPGGAPEDAADAEEYALSAYASWLSQAASAGAALVFLLE